MAKVRLDTVGMRRVPAWDSWFFCSIKVLETPTQGCSFSGPCSGSQRCSQSILCPEAVQGRAAREERLLRRDLLLGLRSTIPLLILEER